MSVPRAPKRSALKRLPSADVTTDITAAGAAISGGGTSFIAYSMAIKQDKLNIQVRWCSTAFRETTRNFIGDRDDSPLIREQSLQSKAAEHIRTPKRCRDSARTRRRQAS
jgi:hypothetical protein